MGASALIVGRPGPLRDGLRALVGSLPQIDAVAVVNDGSSLLMSGIDPAPSLVVLDADSTSDSVWRLARQARLKWSQARIIVLVGSVEEQQEAEDAGADAVLLQGFPAGRLVTAIVKHVPQSVL